MGGGDIAVGPGDGAKGGGEGIKFTMVSWWKDGVAAQFGGAGMGGDGIAVRLRGVLVSKARVVAPRTFGNPPTDPVGDLHHLARAARCKMELCRSHHRALVVLVLPWSYRQLCTFRLPGASGL